MNTEEGAIAKGWVSYRPEIRVLDCTIRDGGLMNNSRFDDQTVRAVYQACVESGIDYMEIGYKNSKKLFSQDVYGCWRHCEEDDVRRIVGDNDTSLKISVMADAEKCDYKTDILPRGQSAIDMIRVACYIHQIPLALDMIKDAHDKGYETCLNIMSISVVQEWELDSALDMFAHSEAKAIYLVDSFGHLYSEQIQYLIRKYLRYAKPAGKEVGIHTHNNLQLAYANTLEGIILGANMIDATMAGLGRGAGNCPMELLIGFLHNPKYRLRPVINCVEHHIEPMRQKLKWGFDLSYLITGLLNRHPLSAMKFNEAESRGDILEFYDKALAGE
jgi:4-hydroxy 2-oxovalerate aldolase